MHIPKITAAGREVGWYLWGKTATTTINNTALVVVPWLEAKTPTAVVPVTPVPYLILDTEEEATLIRGSFNMVEFLSKEFRHSQNFPANPETQPKFTNRTELITALQKSAIDPDVVRILNTRLQNYRLHPLLLPKLSADIDDYFKHVEYLRADSVNEAS